MSKTGRAFVAGATGYVGRQVLRRLCEQGIETVAHIRPASPRRNEWEEHFAALGAKSVSVPWNQESIQSVVHEMAPTLVFSLLGTTRSRGKQESLQGDIYDAVDYRLSKILLDACASADVPPRFIYLSSIGAAENSRSAYLRARGRLEHDLKTSGLSYVSARPSIITGADRDDYRPMERLSAAIGDRALGVVALFGGNRLKERYQSTSATQLADALVRLGCSEFAGVADGLSLKD